MTNRPTCDNLNVHRGQLRSKPVAFPIHYERLLRPEKLRHELRLGIYSMWSRWIPAGPVSGQNVQHTPNVCHCLLRSFDIAGPCGNNRIFPETAAPHYRTRTRT